MALFSTNHTLTQGSLHYRLATLGYQKQNPDGVRQSANILCADPPFEIAIKNGTPMGFVYLQTSFAPIFLLKWLSKVEVPMGFVSLTNSANILCRRSPLLGEGLGVRL